MLFCGRVHRFLLCDTLAPNKRGLLLIIIFTSITRKAIESRGVLRFFLLIQQVSLVITYCPRTGGRRVVRVPCQSGEHAWIERREFGIHTGVYRTNW